jgi:hypothetical protein
MAVSDLYVVQYLLDSTRPANNPLTWQQDDSGAWHAEVNGVSLTLFHTHTMGWSGLCLSFKGVEDAVAYIEEPRPSSFFGRHYRHSDDLRLAESIQALADAVSSQCVQRKTRAWDLRDSLREALYRRVLFGGQ